MATLIDAAALSALSGVPAGQAAALPAAVTAIAEAYCNRPLAFAARDEEYAPGVSRVLRLRGRPVVGPPRVSADLADALMVYFTPPCWRASASLSATALTLTSVVAGVESAQVLALAGRPTVGDLALAVDALDGWGAEVVGAMADCPTSELRLTPGELDARPAAWLQAFTSTIGRFELNPRTGRLTLPGARAESYRYPDRAFGASGGPELVRARYRAGYSSDPADGSPTPGDLAEACVSIARGVLDSRVLSGVASYVMLGNISYTAGSPEVLASVTPNARKLLANYVDPEALMVGFFLTMLAEVQSIAYPQDAAGGEDPTPAPAAGTTAPEGALPCCVIDNGPAPTEGQSRHGTVANCRVFFESDPGVTHRDRLRIYSAASGAYLRTLTCDGPAFDMAGRAAIFEVKARDVR